MSSELRQTIRFTVLWGMGLFLVINAFSWSPGYGGRHDRKPGMEVERFFGWPACYRAELWRSDHPHEVNEVVYMPPVPLSREMAFVYADNSFSGLLINATLAVCSVVIASVLVMMEHRSLIPVWMIVLLLAAGGLVAAAFLLADKTDACL